MPKKFLLVSYYGEFIRGTKACCSCLHLTHNMIPARDNASAAIVPYCKLSGFGLRNIFQQECEDWEMFTRRKLFDLKVKNHGKH